MTDWLLTLDRGNSTLDGMWHGEAAARERVDPRDDAAIERLVTRHAASGVVGLTVVPNGLATVERVLAARGVALAVAGRELPCPLELTYAQPETLGADRWVGAFAAHRLHGAAVVVDCGTAVTVNAVDRQGRFLGGAIAPGPQTYARALAAAAPALPEAVLLQPFEMPANDSRDAVHAGVHLGFCGAVDRLLDEVFARTELVEDRVPIVLTGGLAAVYAGHGRRSCAHEPDLIHRGLRWLHLDASSS